MSRPFEGSAVTAPSQSHNWNPLRLFFRRAPRFSYQRLPPHSSDSITTTSYLSQGRTSLHGVFWREGRWRYALGRPSLTKSIALAIAAFVLLSILVGKRYHQHQKDLDRERSREPPYYWMHFHRLNGYYNGIRTLVPYEQVRVDNAYNQSIPFSLQPEQQVLVHSKPPIDPIIFDPYPKYTSDAYLAEHREVRTCYVDAAETVVPPDVYAYPGVQQHMPEPFFGDYKSLGLEHGMCFERFGRYGGYGYGYDKADGGLGPGQNSESVGKEKVQQDVIDYRNIDWGSAQKRCYEKNKLRFEDGSGTVADKTRITRQAYILRTWTGYEYSAHQIYALRAMISELSLKSGGEYDVHLLVHVKDESIPIWADTGLYQKVIEENVPREFWNISTLWSEALMETYYPGPFPGNFANMASSRLHGVYRAAHFPLQWFAQQHPEYDFFWNWEMDIRYQGHYYEFNSKVGEWGKQQPRKGMWERARRFYFPARHGSWENFTKTVERETEEVDKAKNEGWKSGPVPIWGPVRDFPADAMLESPANTTPPMSYAQDNYQWGVGEDADLLTFNPIFDPSTTNWVFLEDISGYNIKLKPPPRRAAIITVARLSKRLLDTMHKETWLMKHHMFPEMWPPTVAMHHGLKAVYVPHPVYFDRDWDLEHIDQVFNHPINVWDSPYGWGEHNSLGSSFYYNSGFSGPLWRRWLGQWENGAGGRRLEEEGSGRLCLRPLLHHPVKREDSPETGQTKERIPEWKYGD